MGLEFELDVEGLRAALKKAEQNLSKHVPKALEIGAQMVVKEARENHDYNDGPESLLTNSIMADGLEGSFEGGDLTVTVAAGAPYGIFIEKGTKPHIIRPKHRTKLRWAVEGGFAFAGEVHHPGTKAYNFLGNALDAKIGKITENIENATALAFEEAGFEVD